MNRVLNFSKYIKWLESEAKALTYTNIYKPDITPEQRIVADALLSISHMLREYKFQGGEVDAKK